MDLIKDIQFQLNFLQWEFFIVALFLIWVLINQYITKRLIKRQGEEIMSYEEVLAGTIASVDSATTALGVKTQKQLDKIVELLKSKGATPEQIAALTTGFSPIIKALTDMGKPPVTLSVDQVAALDANVPPLTYDGVSPSLTPEQLKCLDDAGFPYTGEPV